MTDDECDKIRELCYYHLMYCDLDDCLIDAFDIIKGD